MNRQKTTELQPEATNMPESLVTDSKPSMTLDVVRQCDVLLYAMQGLTSVGSSRPAAPRSMVSQTRIARKKTSLSS